MSTEQVVAPSEIENELTRIWDSLQGTNKMRACLFNLIIVSEKNRREEYIKDVAKKVIEKFPSRIIFVEFDPEDQTEKLQTSVSVLTANEGECSIVCDLIRIEVSRSRKERIPFLILPHILPDLPVYLVRGDDPTKEDPICLELEHISSRIIFDSETSENLPFFAKTLLSHHEEFDADVADLNWARLEGWRNLLAATFHTQEKLEMLKRSNSIHIHYNCYETDCFSHNKTQGVYLQAWLAHQLEWKFVKVAKEDKKAAFTYENGQGPIQIYLHPTTIKELPPGRIINIEVTTANKEQCTLVRNPLKPHEVQSECSTETLCEMPTHTLMEREASGLSLVREICHNGTSEHFLRTLKAIQHLNPQDLL
ncbi:MAG: glucose-6-phosphate dehydrogenase assembly protein OpcA [Candidatus Algichlamydia australiensis]|nr:glucose-6-phosphate dehydrogenase assembly protein OpcA [Chlamydiales bacterium]